MPDQQIKGFGVGTKIADGGKDHHIGYEIPKVEAMENGPKSRRGETRARSGSISHRPQKLGIEQ